MTQNTRTDPPPEDAAEWVEPEFTLTEALASNLYVAEVTIGDEVIRAYGRDRDEALDRARTKLRQSTATYVRPPNAHWVRVS